MLRKFQEKNLNRTILEELLKYIREGRHTYSSQHGPFSTRSYRFKEVSERANARGYYHKVCKGKVLFLQAKILPWPI